MCGECNNRRDRAQCRDVRLVPLVLLADGKIQYGKNSKCEVVMFVNV